jgi:fermentation-respiration switch protein FrsA (DUF1100 family)
LGVCGYGGLNLSAAAMDKRIKAVATSVMYDMSRLWGKGFQDSYTPEQRSKVLENMSLQRWKDAENGVPAYESHNVSFDKAGNVVRDKTILPATLQADADPITREFFDYYRTRRGYNPRSVKEGANKQVISSQADSLIKISRIWADFFPQTHRISLFRLFFPPFLALFPVFTEISPTDVSFGPPETGWPG